MEQQQAPSGLLVAELDTGLALAAAVRSNLPVPAVLGMTGNLTVTVPGTLAVTGTLTVTDRVTVTGKLTVMGNLPLIGNLAVTGTLTGGDD